MFSLVLPASLQYSVTFICVIAYGCNLFTPVTTLLCEHATFTLSTFDGHVDGFQFEVIIKSSATNILYMSW